MTTAVRPVPRTSDRRDRLVRRLADPAVLVCGIVNVTPDSFSDGGRHREPGCAVRHALRLVDEGAELLDVGGESTRPGSHPPEVDEELDRVIPVIETLARTTSIPISRFTISTRSSVASPSASIAPNRKPASKPHASSSI